MVIDTHTHAWGPASKDYPWVNEGAIHGADIYSTDLVYTAEKLVKDMRRAGVDEALLVGYPINEWFDNSYTVRAVSEFDRLHGIVLIDQFGDDPAGTLRSLMDCERVIGFRVAAMCARDEMWRGFDHDADWLLDTIDDTEFWEAAAETDAVAQLLVHYSQLDQAREVITAYPDVTYVIDHTARVDPSVQPEEHPYNILAELAEFDNVAIKISEVPHRSDEEFPFEDLHNVVRWLIDKFDKDRVIWGSDYPNGSHLYTYRETLEWLNYVDELSKKDIKWICDRSFRNHVSF